MCIDYTCLRTYIQSCGNVHVCVCVCLRLRTCARGCARMFADARARVLKICTHIHIGHYITLHCVALHYSHYRHYITYIPLHCITSHYVTLRCIASYCTVLHCNTLHYKTLGSVALRYITLHYITWHYIKLHCVTLHTYITYIYAPLHVHSNVLMWWESYMYIRACMRMYMYMSL